MFPILTELKNTPTPLAKIFFHPSFSILAIPDANLTVLPPRPCDMVAWGKERSDAGLGINQIVYGREAMQYFYQFKIHFDCNLELPTNHKILISQNWN